MTDSSGLVLRKCFVCCNTTYIKKTRPNKGFAFAKSFCILFNLPNLLYEDQINETAAFCTRCQQNIRQIEFLYRHLQNIKEEIINFRVLLKRQLTEENSSQSLHVDNNETKCETNVPENFTDPSKELRETIIRKIICDSPVKTAVNTGLLPLQIEKAPATITENVDNSNSEAPSNFLYKTEVWSPPASPLLDDGINNVIEGDRCMNSEGNVESCDSGNTISIKLPSPSEANTRRTTRSQTIQKHSIKKINIKREKVKNCNESGRRDSGNDQEEEVIKANSGNKRNFGNKKRKRIKYDQTKKANAVKVKALVVKNGKQKERKDLDKNLELEEEVNKAQWLSCPRDNCNYRFPDEITLDAHIKRYHEGVQKPYTCSVPGCEKSFKNSYAFKEHTFLHTGSKPFMCEFCARTFATKALLRVHTKRIHLEEFSLHCSVCGKGFLSKSILDNHMRKHTKDYRYACHCGKRFSTPRILNIHERAHNDEFKCDQCNKILSSQASLTDHMYIHTGLYPLKCPVCNYGTTNPRILKLHINAHKGIKIECTVCKKQVSERGLNNHMKTHDPERPKKCICDQCGKAFVDRYKLNRHVQYHKGEKPFKCTICDKSFYTKDYLNVHQKYHEKSGAELRNQTRKPRIWKHSVLPNPNIDDENIINAC